MKLNNIQANAGQRRNRKRLGCGIGTGHGKTGGRGHKGQKSRSGGGVMRGFEGGQMSLIRRLPKRGFTPLSRNTFQLVNVGQLNSFESGSTVDAAALYAAGLIRNAVDPVKLLASGDCEVKLTVSVAKTSAAATAKVEKAGGSVAVSA
ncbi:50S ribosomal protein L15 [Ghiorsea bivora]|uniref:50S ribosomal protein L15 n=1 Tax=Ghiorsea bivora TaxID=1485545 RepID=UPI000571CA62|nr:50S ribosomal protein L15 [Ghiorsea bivora]